MSSHEWKKQFRFLLPNERRNFSSKTHDEKNLFLLLSICPSLSLSLSIFLSLTLKHTQISYTRISSLANSVYGTVQPKTQTGSMETPSRGAWLKSYIDDLQNDDAIKGLVWKDVRRGRSGMKELQLTCECCGFWVNARTNGMDGIENVLVRFESRCPVMIFTQMDGVGGRVLRSEAYSFLEARGWQVAKIMEVLRELDLEETGTVDQEELVLWFDATVNVAGGGILRDVESTRAIVQSHQMCMIQFQGSIVQPANAPCPSIWHDQACRHLGIKGTVRLCSSGMIVETSLLLQGSEVDLIAYTDALFAANVSSNTHGIAIPMRRIEPEDALLKDLKIVTHATRNELMAHHKVDVQNFETEFGSPQKKVQTPKKLTAELRNIASKSRPDVPQISSPNDYRALASAPKAPGPQRSAAPPPTNLKPTEVQDLMVVLPAPAYLSKPKLSARSAGRSTKEGGQSNAAGPPSGSARGGTDIPAVSALGTEARAIYDYDGREEDELTIQTGELLQVIARHDDGWFLVQNGNGSFGVVPGNYLQIVDNALSPQPVLLNGNDTERTEGTVTTANGNDTERTDPMWQNPRSLDELSGALKRAGRSSATLAQDRAAQLAQVLVAAS